MDEDVKYDEDKAIEFIRKTLTAEVNAEYDDDDILYIIDIIWEWYEKNGYLDLNSEVTEEEEHDLSKLTDYVIAQLKKDKETDMDLTYVGQIVKGEIEYEESIEDVF
jgi:hypothetical protein